MEKSNLGYHEDPENGEGIIRAKTTGQLRSWELPRKLKSLETLNQEFGQVQFPGIYMLFDDRSYKVYVGEAKNIINRLKTHITSPEDKIEGWSKVLIVNDGRIATQSEFNDAVIRLTIEHYLIRLFKANRYNVVSQGEDQKHNPSQKHIIEILLNELDFFLLKKNRISKLIEEKGLVEVLSDDLKRLIEKKGMKISQWTSKEAVINGETAFIRPGSKKQNGWQITIRGGKSDSFLDALRKGKGNILVSRNGVLLIPLKKVLELVKSTDQKALERDTVDIFIDFLEEGIKLNYKGNSIDLNEYKLAQ